MKLPKKRQPTPPGAMLRRFLLEMGVTQEQLATHLGWTKSKLSEIVNGKRGITPETALAFSDAFGTTPELWLNSQMALDLWQAQQGRRPFKKMVISGRRKMKEEASVKRVSRA